MNGSIVRYLTKTSTILLEGMYSDLLCVIVHFYYCPYFCFRPKSDTCKTCDSLNVRISAEEDIQAKSQLECELQLHHWKAEGAYQQLKEDTALCRTSSNVDMLTFDLQQSLPTPKLATNVVFLQTADVDL